MSAHGSGGYFTIESTSHDAAGLPVSAIFISLLLTLTYVSSLYVVPAVHVFLENRLPGYGKVVSLPWAKIAGTLVVSLLSLGMARMFMTLGPDDKPNCLSDAQILGISLGVDSVFWDILAPLLVTALLMAPLFVTNILVSMVSEAVPMKSGPAPPKEWWSLLGQVLVKKAQQHGNVLFSGDHTIFQDTIKGIPVAKTELVDNSVQCGFTLIFGLYAGSLWTCVMVHSVCNAVGFPDLDLALRLPGPLLLGIGLAGGVCFSLAFALLRLL